ncbi:DNA repair protein RadC [Patescibacteria group bacterium]|nr:DNA repair protein RadC [Patescibacteria group bacterium]
MKNLLLKEHPREKLYKYGSSNLTDIELLAIILRHGGKRTSVLDLSRKIIKNFGGFKNLVDADLNELTSYKYIGKAKATSIKALTEIALRLNNPDTESSIQVNKPKDVYDLVRKDIFGKKKEYLFLISLDTKNNLISKDIVSIGTINEAVIHPREIYNKAIRNNAVSIILAHNHPSNDTTPSKEDIYVTQRIYKTGQIIGIPLLDHLIVSAKDYTSMKAVKLIGDRNTKGGDINEK